MIFDSFDAIDYHQSSIRSLQNRQNFDLLLLSYFDSVYRFIDRFMFPVLMRTSLKRT